MNSDNGRIVYVKNESCEVTELGEGCFMIFAQETAMTYVLNNIMSFLWDRCDGERSTERIIQELVLALKNPEIPSHEIYQDCIEAFQNMEGSGILRKKQTAVC